jgi:hypothetical protein
MDSEHAYLVKWRDNSVSMATGRELAGDVITARGVSIRVAKARKGRGSKEDASADRGALRVSRGTLSRVAGGRVIANHRPTQESQRKLELLMAAIGVLRFDAGMKAPESVPDTYEKLYDRAIEQFLDLYDAEPQFKLPSLMGPTAKRRSIWLRGDLMLRIEAIAVEYQCSASRLIDTAIDTYVDYYTRGIDPKLIATLAGTAQKILEASESTGKVLRERERKARKLMRTGQA